MSTRERKTVVVVGGGFAGREAYRQLAKVKEFYVTLVDARGHFEYTPSILRCFVHSEIAKKVIIPHAVEFTHGTVAKLVTDGLSKDGRMRATAAELDDGQTIPFDYCIVCSGTSYNGPIGAPPKGGGIDARIQQMIGIEKKLIGATNMVVIGGGITGVELAAELAGRFETCKAEASKTVTLVVSKDRVLDTLEPSVSKYCADWFDKYNVKVIYSDRVVRDESGGDSYWGPSKTITTEHGVHLVADVVFWCTGSAANGKVAGVETGQITSSLDLMADGYSNVFCAGDVAKSASVQAIIPANLAAGVCVKNVQNMEAGKKLLHFPRDVCGRDVMPTICNSSLYKHDGVIQLQSLVIKGKMAAIGKQDTENQIVAIAEESKIQYAMHHAKIKAMLFATNWCFK